MNPSVRKYGYLPSENLVPDVLAEGLDVVFCGTALGRVSAQRRAYYAHPGNFFWRTLKQAGFTQELLAPADYASVLRYGIGLTDLCKTAYGNDDELPAGAFDTVALRHKIGLYRPRYLAFTSKTGAASVMAMPTGKIAYGVQPLTIGTTQLFVLPSPSGHARRYWDASIWKELALLIGRN